MISFFVNNAINRPVAVIMITIMVVVFGIGAIFFLPMDFYPPISIPKLTIATTYNGLPAKEVQELLTIPIEDTVSSLPGLKKISSSSLDSISIIELTFSWGTDIKQAGIQAREMTDIAALELPEGAAKPMVLPVNPTEKPILFIGIFPKDTITIPALKELCDREIKSMIQQAPGVGSVQILGGLDKEIVIEPNPFKLGSYSIPIQSIAQAIQATNTEIPAGSIEQGKIEYIVKTESMIRSPKDILNTPLYSNTESATTVLLHDIAEVVSTTADRNSFVLQNGNEGIGILIRSQGKFSPVTLSQNVQKKLREIQNIYFNSINITILSDSSTLIQESIRDLVISAIAGILIAFFVILVFLRTIRSSLIMTTSIPMSLLSTIALFPITGIGINTMSIGGLAIGIGMLVDNSVVVLENLQKKANPNDRNSVIEATLEIANSTVGSTITSLIVFLPLFFLPGIIGVVFKDLAWAVSFSLLSSFIVSISVVPVLFCRFGHHENTITNLNTMYRFSLKKVYRNPVILLITSIIVLIGGFSSYFLLDTDWLDTTESNKYLISIELAAGTSMDHQFNLAKKMTLYLSTHPQISSSYVYGGGNYNDPYYLTGKNPEFETLYCHIVIKPHVILNTDQITQLFQDLLSNDNSIIVRATPDSLSFNDILGFSNNDITTYPIPGKNYDDAFSYANQIKRQYPESEISISPKSSRPRIIVKPRSNASDALHLNNESIAQFIGSYLFGVYAGSLNQSNERIPIKIRLAKQYRDSPEALGILPIPLSSTSSTILNEVVIMDKNFSPPVYYRNNRQNVVYLKVHQAKKNVTKSINQLITDMETKEWKQQLRTIFLLFCASIFFMYILLGIQFNSFFLPLLLLGVIPFGFSGVLMSLLLCGKSLTLNGILGTLVVIGVVVNNGIIFYDHYSYRITKPNLSLLGTYRGANNRIRAIMISFMTTLLALIPIAINITKKNPQSAMATAIIGGISISCLVSIYGFPIIFYRYFNRKTKDRTNES